MSRVDDGSKPSLDGLTDRGVQSHGVTRASHLRVGQKLELGWDQKHWHALTSVRVVDGQVRCTAGDMKFSIPEASLIKVRDILHPYTTTESDTP
jgi:hypothetical protein